MQHLDILMERLRQFDEVTLLELLEITADEILERFTEKVVAKADYLSREVELWPEAGYDTEDERAYSEGFSIRKRSETDGFKSEDVYGNSADDDY